MIQWRFGLDVGRRWKNGGNGASEAATADGDGKSSSEPKGLGAGSAIIDILDTYDKQQADQSRVRESLEEERRTFRKTAQAMIDDVIEPTLQIIGEEVLGRGHHWSVEGRVDIQSQPAVACLFRPASALPGGPASELTFRCLFPDRVSTTAQIHHGSESFDPPARSHLATSMGAELVKKEVARFMQQVLAGEPVER